MLRQIEESRAVAEAVTMCGPDLIAAWPATPQSHIIEALGAKARTGRLRGCAFLRAESGPAAMSMAIGAAAVGARTYTATASEGLLNMSEALYTAAGLGLPVVMTVVNRAADTPVNLWNDHSDAMAQRDAGWIQLYAETSQEAIDLHIQAFRLAGELSAPVMICLDGFPLTHPYERADIPAQAQVDAFLPVRGAAPGGPARLTDAAGPAEARYLAHARESRALGLIPELAAEFAATFGRDSGGLVRGYRIEDAETVVVALGSALGTIKATVDELRDGGMRVGILGITTFRPFPCRAIREILGADRRVRRLVVVERALGTGMGGIVSADLRVALATGRTAGAPYGEPIVSTVIAGLGGQPVTRAALRNALIDASAGALEPLSFLPSGTAPAGLEPGSYLVPDVYECGSAGRAGRGAGHAREGRA